MDLCLAAERPGDKYVQAVMVEGGPVIGGDSDGGSKGGRGGEGGGGGQEGYGCRRLGGRILYQT